ncbi:MAG: MBL fold metallo-hydrolase [Anaerolineae bacterium]|nr:MBL fold metallo-hydrolase [Anaerolineae bacterium]
MAYIINTHHHADHTTGTSFFHDAPVISHLKCRELLNTRGRESLQRSKEKASDMADVKLVLPTIVFDNKMTLRIGGKTLHLEHSPGHSPDSIVVWIEEENVLFAADTVMPIPYFVDGSYDDFLASLKRLQGRGFENIVQGHGEIILRGEVEKKN